MPILALLAAVGVTAVVVMVAVIMFPPVIAAAAIIWACGAWTAPLVLPLAVIADIGVWTWQAHLTRHQQNLPHTFQLIWFGGPIVLAVLAYPIGRARRQRSRTARTRRPARQPTAAITPEPAAVVQWPASPAPKLRAPQVTPLPAAAAAAADLSARAAEHLMAARKWTAGQIARRAATEARQRTGAPSSQSRSRWRARP